MANQRSTSSHQRQLLRERAHRMRCEPTRTEWLLWHALSARQQGATFRRQVVLCGYIVDFYASEAKLIVEVDGAWHGARARADERRDSQLMAAGYRVLRVSAETLVSSPVAVLAQIREAVGST